MKSHNLEQLFPPPELERITEAVQQAERMTCGEIVPYVVPRSDSYPEGIWRGVSGAMALALLVMGVIPFITDRWMPFGVSTVASIALATGIIAGALVVLLPGLRLLLAGNAAVAGRVAQRAAQAFVAEEVFNTGERTGILIFLSLMERRVIVLGDAGINARVQQAEWNSVTGQIRDGIRSGRPADGLVQAIERCGRLLAERGFAIGLDDTNELPNRLRLGDRPPNREPEP